MVLEGYQLAIEFRNRTWFEDKHRSEVLAFEREHGPTHVVVDEPQGFTSSIPAVWEITTSNLAMFRLHERNAATWEKKGLSTSSERFDCEYQESELREFLSRHLADQAAQVHAVFNNNLRDQRIRGANCSARCLALTAAHSTEGRDATSASLCMTAFGPPECASWLVSRNPSARHNPAESEECDSERPRL